jgi:hypothetical protein
MPNTIRSYGGELAANGNVRVLLAWCRHNRGVGIQTASLHLRLKIENAKRLHAVVGRGIFFVHHGDVAKAQGFDQGLHDCVMWHRFVG